MLTLRRLKNVLSASMVAVSLAATGCMHTQMAELAAVPTPGPQPWELSKVSLPEYIIEPPDILQIDALYLVPKPPYVVQTLDTLAIRVPKSLPPPDNIDGLYTVDPDGTVNLGAQYGSVQVAGKTLAEVKTAIETHLAKMKFPLKEPETDVAVAQGRGVQQIRGPHLVRPDGTISLGSYGSVRVVGMTIAMAKEAIEAHLAQFLQNPEVSVDIAAYNSKVFYLIYDGGGAGQQVYRLPITGNDTVLDAVSQVGGLSGVADTHRIWVARPTPDHDDCILPVDWSAVTARGKPQTNYQLQPGDRLFVQSDPWIRADVKLARRIAPFERLFGFSILTAGTIQTLKFQNNGGNGAGGIGGGF